MNGIAHARRPTPTETVELGVDRPDASGPPPEETEAWRDLAILGAVLAVWSDLSVDVRMRIADGAVAALGREHLPAEPAP